MSLQSIPNQPIDFGTDINDPNVCECKTYEFCQLVENDDITQFQVNLTEATGVNLITAGDFSTACGVDWTCGANWNIAAGKASKTAGAANNLTQTALIEANKYYKITYTVDSISGDDLTPTLATVALRTVTAAGTFTDFTQIGPAPANLDMMFVPAGAGTVCQIDDVSVVEMSTLGWLVRDEETRAIVLDEGDGLKATYLNDNAQGDVDWGGITAGCYEICATDPSRVTANLVNDPGFATACGTGNWTCTGSWNIAAGVATATAGFGNSFLSTTSFMNIGTNAFLKIQVEITAFTAGSLVVRIADPIFAVIGTFNTVGVHTIYYAATGPNVVIDFFADNATTLSIDNVVLGLVPESCSQCFQVQADWDCTLLHTFTNNEDAYGFIFNGQSFTPQLRLKGKKRHPHYPREKEVFMNSVGARSLLYSRQWKTQDIVVREVPEYIHSALSLGLEMDTYTIDGITYSFEQDSYDPDWRNSSTYAPIIYEVIESPQDLVNSNC